MATREEARSAVRLTLDRYERSPARRYAYMGDGRGHAASNLIVQDNPAYVYVRNKLDSTDFFVVRMNRNVRPAFNIPVEIHSLENGQMRIFDVADTFLDQQTSASSISGVAPHHPQHEFGGGDEVFIDERLFKPGLVQPTDPASMSVKVFSFIYYYNDWQRYAGATTDDFSQYKPAIGNRYILIALDQDTNDLIVVPGDRFIAGSWDTLLTTISGFNYIPSPPGDAIPLAAILLTSSTTKIDWNSNGVDNLLSMRIMLSSPNKNMLDRIRQLEGLSGNPPNLAVMGAATDTVDENIARLVDGGEF